MRLRPLDMSDTAMVLRWSNDRATRHASFNHAPISFDEHREWMKRSVRRRDTFIAEHAGTPVGMVRPKPYISIVVAPEHRMKGHGTDIIKTIQCMHDTLEGWVKDDNIASIAMFKGCGFEPVPHSGIPLGYTRYAWQLKVSIAIFAYASRSNPALPQHWKLPPH